MIFAIIGSGNVATHVSLALSKNGHSILQVYSRNFSNAQTLASKINAKAISSLSQIHQSVEAIILAVSDDAVSVVLKELSFIHPHNPIIIHTSGTLPIAVLSAIATQYGVLYPLQTFSKNVEINFLNVPLCVEANNKKTKQALLKIANSISNLVYTINSHQRKVLHIAAVFACNFTNYFYAIADDLLQQNQLSFDMLKPLITETANKILANTPHKGQTGPAKRNDTGTINSHLSALSQQPNYRLLYKLISDSIVEKHKND
ncbi:MAG: DUF2520 domain-containing protein [Sphingobacteriales bacterium]|nr:MAG: DUF2520 domain-containing protein [Sphingobacteriales bacterium]TAF82212.1 MAG: DUF2520 domain-containing protein [Sphingobacteriales bacterium]